jgi:two-component system, OmpR family, sensor histidine kinase KdpD
MSNKEKEKIGQFLIILAMLALTTIVNIFLEYFIQPSSLVFVYLVPAIAGAIYFGVWASVLSFVAGFFIFNFGFVEPYYSLHISNPQDIYNVIVYFTIAGLITYLINVVRRQNAFLKSRLEHVSFIEDMSRDLLLLMPIEQSFSAQDPTEPLRTRILSQLGQLALKYTKTILDAPALIFFREEDDSLKIWAKSSAELEITKEDSAAAAFAFNNGDVCGAGTYTHSDSQFYFIPLKSLVETIGVLGISYNSKDLFPEQRHLLEAISNLTTMVAVSWMHLRLKKS